MTENKEAIRGNLGGKYLVREREGSRDTENTCGTGESSGTTPNKQTRENLATHPQDDERLRFAIAQKNIVFI